VAFRIARHLDAELDVVFGYRAKRPDEAGPPPPPTAL
jgi:hypothetical protein